MLFKGFQSSNFDSFDNHLRRRQHGMSAAEELAKIEEERAKQTELITDALTIGGTAAGLGWWSGRYGMPAPFGIPADLIAAGVSYGLVAFGGALGLGNLGKYDRVLADVGHGSLAHYLTFWGTRTGRRMRASAGEAALTEAQETGAGVAGWEYQGGQLAQGMGGYTPFGQQHQRAA